VLTHNVGAVELVPHHAVIKAGGLLHQATGKCVFIQGAFHQKAESLHPVLRIQDGVQHTLHHGIPHGFWQADRRFNAVVVGNHHIGVAGFRFLYQQLGGIGLDEIIRIHKLKVFAVGFLHAKVAGGGNSAVVFVDHHNAAVNTGIALADGIADILAAIVEQNDLQIPVGLAADALNTAGNMVRCVVNRNNNAD